MTNDNVVQLITHEDEKEIERLRVAVLKVVDGHSIGNTIFALTSAVASVTSESGLDPNIDEFAVDMLRHAIELARQSTT